MHIDSEQGKPVFSDSFTVWTTSGSGEKIPGTEGLLNNGNRDESSGILHTYPDMHSYSDTWDNACMKLRIAVTLTDEKTRIAYN